MEKEKSKEVLLDAADTTLESKMLIAVDVQPQSLLHRILQRWKLLPVKKHFHVRPIYLGTLIRISKIMLEIEIVIPDLKAANASGHLLEANYKAIGKHAPALAEILALAIRNNSSKTDKKLVRFILNNFTPKEMMGVLALVLKQMDLSSFMTSIISIRGLNVLENTKAANAKSAND